jgi:hypothetical protein
VVGEGGEGEGEGEGEAERSDGCIKVIREMWIKFKEEEILVDRRAEEI